MIPKHIAIIMDGNGRWAKKRNFPRTAGHKEGVERVKEIVNVASELGVKVLTVFVFSTENWNRPKREVNMLMNYLANFLKDRKKYFYERNIRFTVIGRDDHIPEKLKKSIKKTIEETADNSGLTLNLALDYGSRYEIVNAAKIIARKAREDRSFDINNINETYFSKHLYTKDMPDPDLLIRTSGEQRISNFMLWQISYAELYFCDKFWPDFKREDFEEAIEVFNKRRRRFGEI